MINNVTTVSVKNKLGNQFGNRQVQVNTWANQQTTSSLTILPWGEKRVYPINPEARQPVDPVSLELDSIEIEVLEGVAGIPIPIGIDSTDDLNVEVIQVIGQNTWTIKFNPPGKPGNLPIKLGGKGGDSNVNVTLGQDEPPNIVLYLLVALLIGFLIGLMVGLSL